MPWLPEPPDDFRAQLKALGSSSDLGAAFQRLGSYRLGNSEATNLSKAILKAIGQDAELTPLAPYKLAIVSSATADFVAGLIPAAAARHGVACAIHLADFGQIEQELLDAGSSLYAAEPNASLIMIDHRWAGLDRVLFGQGKQQVEAALSRIDALVGALADQNVRAIVPTLAVPPMALFGSFDSAVDGSVRAMVEDFNRRLIENAAAAGAYILDVAALAARIGTDTWFDAVQWNAYKLPFWSECGPIFADHVARLIGSICGKARKCLVLDLDNTLWGGVIGDDGMAGIKIGQGSVEGEAFATVQALALDLKARGIILAVSSKNDDATAREPFETHPDMLLRLSDIAAFQANWEDKWSNIEAIAKTLNIGVDSLVFLDDNPSERAQVRAALPMVAVPELPDEPALYPWFLASAGYFESVSFTAEDRSRSTSYALDAQRSEIQKRSLDLGDYLRALDMEYSLTPFDDVGAPRIAALINKSNQFNLTTRRYDLGEVLRFKASSRHLTIQGRLRDKFSDLGMICVVIVDREEEAAGSWRIDTWLMSCRVLGRKVEEATLATLLSAARAAAVGRIEAHYIPTAKNNMVRDHYDKLGFSLVAESESSVRSYELIVADVAASPNLPLSIQATHFAAVQSVQTVTV